MEKKKVTKHTIKDLYGNISDYLIRHKEENKKITGIVFSNEGSKGREPLFDVSFGQTNDIFAYWEDEKNGIICVSAEKPGYEVRAPKNMRQFFQAWYRSNFLVTYLDVTHLDVSKTTNFSNCFTDFGWNMKKPGTMVPARIVGLETWNISNGFCFDSMFFGAFPGNKSVDLNLSGWKIDSEYRQSFRGMFYNFAPNANEVVLNVSGWDMHGAKNLSTMFKLFAPQAKHVKIYGIEDWRLGIGNICLSQTFERCASVSEYYLDLSNWAEKCNLKPDMDRFAAGTFFKIKEPAWKNH